MKCMDEGGHTLSPSNILSVCLSKVAPLGALELLADTNISNPFDPSAPMGRKEGREPS